MSIFKDTIPGCTNQGILSITLILLLIQPAGSALAQSRAESPRSKPVLVAAARKSASPAPIAPAPKKLTPRVAPQVGSAVAGQSATLLPDGRTLLLGGAGLTGSTGAAGLREAKSRSVAALTGTLQHPRAWHSATVLPDGRVLIFGGLDAKGLVGDVELFDPAAQRFDSLATAVAPRAYHTATVLTDGHVLIVGGVGKDGRALSELELFDQKTMTVEAPPPEDFPPPPDHPPPPPPPPLIIEKSR